MKYICKECGKENQEYPSENKLFCNMGCYARWKSKNWSNPWNKGLKGFRTSGSFKKGTIPWNKGKQNPLARNLPHSFKNIDMSGSNNCNWKGGISLHKRRMNEKRAILWRKEVFERDNYTCQDCTQIGGKLEAHHIKAWSKYLDLRYKLDNGTTLCIGCHRTYKKDLDGCVYEMQT